MNNFPVWLDRLDEQTKQEQENRLDNVPGIFVLMLGTLSKWCGVNKLTGDVIIFG